jgi:hypothetical protein
MSNYKTVPNFQNSTVEIRANARDGSKLFHFPFDERKDIVKQLQDIGPVIEFVMMNPALADVENITRATRLVDAPQNPEKMSDHSIQLIVMVDFYRNVLALLHRAYMAQDRLLDMLAQDEAIPNEYYVNAVDNLKSASMDFKILLDLHSTESGPTRDSETLTDSTTKAPG